NPRRRICLWISDRHIECQRIGISVAPALDEDHLIGMRIAEVIEPGAIVVAGRRYNECVCVPFSNGVSHPGGIWILRKSSAVDPNLAPDIVILHVYQHSVRGLNNLEWP